MADDLSGRVEAVLLTAQRLPATLVDAVEVTWEGFVGDKHFGLTMKSNSQQKPYPKGTEVRNVRQVSIVSVEELQTVAANLSVPRVEPAWVGANLLLSGIPDLTRLPSGSRLHFEGGVGIVIEGENLPCTTAGGCVQQQFPDRPGITSAFPKRALGKRGLVAWVERPGVIRTGESVLVRRPEALHT
jgi:MOSC domain-containing protein YiiM